MQKSSSITPKTSYRPSSRAAKGALYALAAAFLFALPLSTLWTRDPSSPNSVVVRNASTTPVAFPNKPDSLKFAVLGDFGTGGKSQYELAVQMAKLHQEFKFELVLLVGDNLYGLERSDDFIRKFEKPYKPLLDAGVKFYASLGNHDAREQRHYKFFNMNGKFYYSFQAPKENVRFFALDSTYPIAEQISWIEDKLRSSDEPWKIAFFHHPLYSSGKRHGSDLKLREVLEPLFIKYNVSVVLTGHDHIYERTKPQNGIVYFVVGSGGKLRPGDINPKSGITARGFDTDLAFMAVELFDHQMFFHAISRKGVVVDSGVIEQRQKDQPTFGGGGGN